MRKALVVIDVQNDYFPGGKFPLWNTDETLRAILGLVDSAKKNDIPVVLVQHVADPVAAPFFNKGSEGALIHSQVLEAAPDAPIVVKGRADSFYETNLESLLDRMNVDHVLLCGMMTQNCVTHTALSKTADKYKVSVLPDACTTVDKMIHVIAIGALEPRGLLASSGEIFRS